MGAALQAGSLPEILRRAGVDTDSGKVVQLRVEYHGPKDPWTVEVDPNYLAEILEPWSGRRRAFLVGLINGLSRTHAAAAAGISMRSTQLWARNERAFAEAVEECSSIGIATVLESELYRRAMAGKADPGSMKALIMIMKARCPEYR